MKSLDLLNIKLNNINLIEASAGTGKTYSISSFYIRFLLEKQLDARNILVVTFTKAATEELRLRIRTRIKQALNAIENNIPTNDKFLQDYFSKRHDKREDDAILLLNALNSMDEAAIFTIHGFCQRILSEHAFESSVNFDAELIQDVSEIKLAALKDFWRYYFYDDTENFRIAMENNWHNHSYLLRYLNLLIQPSNAFVFPAVNDSNGMNWVPYYFNKLSEFAKMRLYTEKQDKNIMFFDDLIVKFRDALNSKNGELLANHIRKRYPVALVDEFQDTDDVQYEIFYKLYHNRDDCSFFMIGDPKQAIYSFRGADIFAYIKAKNNTNPETSRFTLDTNWRSEKSMLSAINSLFLNSSEPFIFNEIPYHNIKAPGTTEADKESLIIDGKQPKPIQLWLMQKTEENTGGRRTNGEFVISKERANFDIAKGFAGEISRLIYLGAEGKAKIGERNLQAKDIAVLVRSHRQAEMIQEALKKFGVASVYVGRHSVYATEEALELFYVLNALVAPLDDNMLFPALTTKMMSFNLSEIMLLRENEGEYQKIVSKFHLYYEIWNKKGFLVMFYKLLTEQNIHNTLLKYDDGERRLTNLMQIAELLSETEQEIKGNESLLRWYSEKIQAEAETTEDEQLRLESDEELVKIFTIHKSKGLEFPIVFLPFICDAQKVKEKEPFIFHDVKNNNRITFNALLFDNSRYKELKKLEERLAKAKESYSDKQEKFVEAEKKKNSAVKGFEKAQDAMEKARVKLAEAQENFNVFKDELNELEVMSAIFNTNYENAENERLAEDLRLLYVAFTRSKYILYLSFGIINNYHKSAVSYLLGIQDGMKDLADDFEGEYEKLKELWLKKLDNNENYIDFFEPVIKNITNQLLPVALRNKDLKSEEFKGKVTQQYDVKSFSSISPRYEPPEKGIEIDTATENGYDEDTLLISSDKFLKNNYKKEEVNEFTFPKGTNSGTLFHTILEDIDFNITFDDILAKSDNYLSIYGIDKKWGEILSKMVINMLTTHLDDHKTLRLSDINQNNCIKEMEFYFSVSRTEASELQNILKDLGDFRESHVMSLNFKPFAGYIKGYIDLVFEHNGKYYIVDYKTNYLGSAIEDYSKDKITSAVYEHSYYLQYCLYSFAIHRHLKFYLENYDYDTHFGGVYYLFARGMRPELNNKYGIYFNRPEKDLIEKLDKLLLVGG